MAVEVQLPELDQILSVSALQADGTRSEGELAQRALCHSNLYTGQVPDRETGRQRQTRGLVLVNLVRVKIIGGLPYEKSRNLKE